MFAQPTPSFGPLPRFVVMTAKAKMPSSCWGTYGKVAVVETDGVRAPKQIHPLHAAVRSIRFLADRLNIGTTDRCAFKIALAKARIVAAELNAAAGAAV